MKLHLRNRVVSFKRPLVMGILNVTPDSFSDGGQFLDSDSALRQAEKLIADGADIIDVGGESTRPGARRLGINEEIERILPVIGYIKKEFDTIVSVDTYKARVAEAAVSETGADMVNDISAFAFDESMGETIARLDVPVVIMHIKGVPESMQDKPYYQDVVGEVTQYFQQKLDYAHSLGIRKEKIIIDPGIGFGKRFEDNLEIIRHLVQFRKFDVPILIGLSRKSFLGFITAEKLPAQREVETVAANVFALLNGASIIRVHQVKNGWKTLEVVRKLS